MSNVNNLAQVQPEYQKQEQKKPEPHILSEDEIKKIPDSEKKELMLMPGEPLCIWTDVITKDGQKIGWSTSITTLERITPVFFSMLKAIEPTGKTHLVFGEMKFGLTKYNSCFRGHYKPGSQPWKPSASAAKPKYLDKVVFGSPDELNDFLDKDENKNQWELLGDWKIDADRNITIGMFKQSK
jgi:hypothetical protein